MPEEKEEKKTTKVATKKTTTKSTTKKPATKKEVKKRIDPRTGRIIVETKKTTKKEPKKEEEKKTSAKKTTAKKTPAKKTTTKTTKKTAVKVVKEPDKTQVDVNQETTRKKVSSKELTIEPPARVPEEIVRPKPKKAKQLTKEEKALYKELDNDFSFVANMTTVIEERTMDKKAIENLTIGELHVIETVNKNNNKPMSIIASKEHVTVGALTICVNRLVQKGYLLRTRDEMDHRIILLSITPKGKKVIKTHDEFHETILGLVLENGVTLAQAHKVMSVFAKYLEGYYDPKSLEEKPAKKTKK